MSDQIKFEGVEIQQNGLRMFVGYMSVGDLLAVSDVDVWHKEDEKDTGYQRTPERARARAVAKFLMEDGPAVMPLSVLLSYRGQFGQELTVGVGAHRSICFAPGSVLWQVDGQHRLSGFRVAIQEEGRIDLAGYPLPVVIVENMSETQEAEQFRVINETAKKVRTDLARRILLQKARESGQGRIIKMGRLWEVKATDVLELLAVREDSPWHGRIQRPNDKHLKEHVVKELSFSNSLRPVVNDPNFRRRSATDLAKWLCEYWQAWQELVPEAFDNSSQYVLLKTPGVFSLHMLAPVVFALLIESGLEINRTELRSILGDLDEYATAQYWDADNSQGASAFGSMKGFGILFDLMLEQLQNHGYDVSGE
jgi:DGQHR domain-containing protein